MKRSKYKNPDPPAESSATTSKINNASKLQSVILTGKDVFRLELIADKFYSAILKNLSIAERSDYINNQWEMLTATTKQLYLDEAAIKKQ